MWYARRNKHHVPDANPFFNTTRNPRATLPIDHTTLVVDDSPTGHQSARSFAHDIHVRRSWMHQCRLTTTNASNVDVITSAFE